jgi:hypothetical protein
MNKFMVVLVLTLLWVVPAVKADGPMTLVGEISTPHPGEPGYTLFTASGDYYIVGVGPAVTGGKKSLKQYVGHWVEVVANAAGPNPNTKNIVIGQVKLAPPVPEGKAVALPLKCGTLTFARKGPYRMRVDGPDFWGTCDVIRKVDNSQESANCVISNNRLAYNEVKVRLNQDGQFEAVGILSDPTGENVKEEFGVCKPGK